MLLAALVKLVNFSVMPDSVSSTSNTIPHNLVVAIDIFVRVDNGSLIPNLLFDNFSFSLSERDLLLAAIDKFFLVYSVTFFP